MQAARGECSPHLHPTASETLATPLGTWLCRVPPSLPTPFLQSYSVPYKPRRNCAFSSGSSVSLKENGQKCPFRNRIFKLPGTGGRLRRGGRQQGLDCRPRPSLSPGRASERASEPCGDWKVKPRVRRPACLRESCRPPDSAVALEHPGCAELCKGTLGSGFL